MLFIPTFAVARSECIIRSVASGSGTCPSCGKLITEADISLNEKLQNMVKALQALEHTMPGNICTLSISKFIHSQCR